MNIFSIVLTILGLSLFEIVSSVDNAIINAEVLSTMKPKARRWFLLWGLVFAVFVLRGLLPWALVWAVTPSLGPVGALTASLSGDPKVLKSLESSFAVLLIGGGTFMIFLFFHWLFMEDKNFGLPGERFVRRQSVWFYAVVSILLSVIVWFALKENPYLAFGSVLGSTAFFIIHGFRQNAEIEEKRLLSKESAMSDISKVLYLEAIDASFSIDGVIGAFAFTFSVPIILLGNGLGALVLRRLTISNIDRIKTYRYLKNGAMYSILVLGTIMVLNGFGFHIPEWISPILTLIIVVFFFARSVGELKK